MDFIHQMTLQQILKIGEESGLMVGAKDKGNWKNNYKMPI